MASVHSRRDSRLVRNDGTAGTCSIGYGYLVTSYPRATLADLGATMSEPIDGAPG